MKRILSRIILLVMLTSFFACTGELENAGGNIGDKAKVQLNFTGVNGFAVTRTVDQTAVSNATVYLFDGKEAESSLIYTLPVVLAEPSETSGPSGTFETPEGGTFHIEVITNADQLTGIETYSDFLSKTTTAAISGNLVMQGSAANDVTLTAGTIADINIELVRLAATFTVTGAEEAGLTDVSFTLKDAVKASYFVKHVSDDSFTIPADAEKGNSEVPYSYENPENTTSIVINGQMNGAAYTTEIAIEKVLRNHLYTVRLVNNNGTIEPKLTVTDWADISAGLIIGAGKELKMTASIDDAGVVTPVSTVVYPEEGALKSTATIVVPVSESNTVYKIWVGSANIEAALTNTALPEGWTLTPPAETRADYLWEKGHWTLTIPANTATEAKSVTITATNKLVASAKVQMTFEQEGKVEEGTNPGDMDNWGGGDNPQGPGYSEGSVTGRTTVGWCKQGRFMYNTTQYFAKSVTFSNGIRNSARVVKDARSGYTLYNGTGAVLCSHSYQQEAIFYQWGRSIAFPSTVAAVIVSGAYGYQDTNCSSELKSAVGSANWLKGVSNKLGFGYCNTSGEIDFACYATKDNDDGWNIDTQSKINDYGIIYYAGSNNKTNRDYYTGNTALTTLESRGGDPCPAGYRMPTAEELSVLIPTGGRFTGSHSEIKNVNGAYYAMQWTVTPYTIKRLPYVTIKSVKVAAGTNISTVDFTKASAVNLGALGYIDNAGTFTISSDGYYMGLYWSSDYVSSTGRIKYLEIDINGNSVEMEIWDNASPSWGACILPIKDAKATGKGSVITPLLPLFEL